uniref:Histone-lysine N-methyltransferase SETMAR n=1 Tax=Strongyloides papillosus TaxID=174720 RepID=A0A0N5C9U7_STREA
MDFLRQSPNVSKTTLEKLGELEYETLSHPAYPPDLVLTNFYLFKHLDNFLTKKTFRRNEDTKTVFEASIEHRTLYFYANGINKLVSRWQQCVNSNGSYFE